MYYNYLHKTELQSKRKKNTYTSEIKLRFVVDAEALTFSKLELFLFSKLIKVSQKLSFLFN